MRVIQRHRLGAFVLAAALVISVFASDCLAEVPEFLNKTAVLMRAGQYGPAVTELDRLLSEQQESALLCRLKGICLMELGEEDNAVVTLQRGVELEPENVACRFYLAQALAYRGSVGEALGMLAQLQEMAPDSVYAQRADDVIPRLKGLVVSANTTPQVKRLSVFIRASTEYDDNVPSRSDDEYSDEPAESWRSLASVYLEYKLLDQRSSGMPATLGMAYSAYVSRHVEGRYEGYDLVAHNGSVFARRSGRLLLPYSLDIEGSYGIAELGLEPYSETLGASGSLGIQLTDWAMITPRYSVAWKEFENDTTDPAMYSRDGTDQTMGIDQSLYLFDNRLIVCAGYAYRIGRTDGDMFNINSHNGNGSVHLAIPFGFRLSGSIDYCEEDYLDYTPDPRRVDNSWNAYASLSSPLIRDLFKAQLSYSRVMSGSTVDFADYERNVYGASVRCSF